MKRFSVSGEPFLRYCLSGLIEVHHGPYRFYCLLNVGQDSLNESWRIGKRNIQAIDPVDRSVEIIKSMSLYMIGDLGSYG